MGNKTVNDISQFFSRSSSAYYYAANGMMVLASPDEMRMEYDPSTGELKGLLIEYQATNVLTNTEDFSATMWGKSDLTISTDSQVSPNGVDSADVLIANTTSGIKRLSNIANARPTNASRTWYTLSYYVKPKGNTQNVQLFFGQDFNDGGSVGTFRLSGSGSATASGNVDTKVFIQKIANNGWYRCSVSGRSNTNSSPYSVYISPLNQSDLQTYTGDGVSGMYLWGAQLERGDVPTSYIPSPSGLTSTRYKDTLSIRTDPWFSKNTANFAVYSTFPGTVNISGTTISRNTYDGLAGNFTKFRVGDIVSFTSNSSNLFVITTTSNANAVIVNVSPGAVTDTTIFPVLMPRQYQSNITMRFIYSSVHPGIYFSDSKLYVNLDDDNYKRYFYTSAGSNSISSYDSIANNVPGTNTMTSLTISAASSYNTSFKGIAANGNSVTFTGVTNANMLFSVSNVITIGNGSYGVYLKKFEYYPTPATAAQLLAFTANT